MPYKNSEKQNEYLRKWREKRRNIRVKQGRKVARNVFFLLSCNNPTKYKAKVLQILPLVFGRLLDPSEEEILWNHYISFPKRFLESMLIAWRESYRRDISLDDFHEILFSCERPYPGDTEQ